MSSVQSPTFNFINSNGLNMADSRLPLINYGTDTKLPVPTSFAPYHVPGAYQSPDYEGSINVLAGQNEEVVTVDKEAIRKNSPYFAAMFTVYKDIIRNKSPFLPAAVSSSLVECRDGIARLPNITPSVFRYYKHWVNSHCIDSAIFQMTSSNNSTCDSGAIQKIFELHVAAKYLMDSALEEKTIEWVEYAMRFWCPDHSALTYLYNNTSKDSRMRHSVIDWMARQNHAGFLDGEAGLFPNELLVELLKRLYGGKLQNGMRALQL